MASSIHSSPYHRRVRRATYGIMVVSAWPQTEPSAVNRGICKPQTAQNICSCEPLKPLFLQTAQTMCLRTVQTARTAFLANRTEPFNSVREPPERQRAKEPRSRDRRETGRETGGRQEGDRRETERDRRGTPRFPANHIFLRTT